MRVRPEVHAEHAPGAGGHCCHSAACSRASPSAASTASTFGPPPATTSLPRPTPPPSALAAGPAIASADAPRSTRSLLTATATAALPSALPTSPTTPLPSARNVSTASCFSSPVPRPSWRTTSTPRVALRREIAGRGRRFPRLESLHFVLERPHLLDEPLDLLGQFLRRGAQQVAGTAEQLLLLLDVLERAVARHRLDAPEVGADRSFAHDLDRTDETERVDVRTAAQLDRRAGIEHPHGVAVLLTEERDRAEPLGLGLARLEVTHRDVGDDLRVREPLDLDQLLGGDRLVVAEVEPQPVGRDQRAGLLHVGTEHLAQRPVQDVRGRVVAPDAVAPDAVDRRGHGVALGDRAGPDARLVHGQHARQPVAGVLDVEDAAVVGPPVVEIVPVSPTWPPDSA